MEDAHYVEWWMEYDDIQPVIGHIVGHLIM